MHAIGACQFVMLQNSMAYQNPLFATNYTRFRITRTRLYRIIAYFEGHLPHQKSLH